MKRSTNTGRAAGDVVGVDVVAVVVVVGLVGVFIFAEARVVRHEAHVRTQDQVQVLDHNVKRLRETAQQVVLPINVQPCL